MPLAGSHECAYCGGQVPFQSVAFGEMQCSSCGKHLWFLTIDGRAVFFRHSDAAFVRQVFRAAPYRFRGKPRADLVKQMKLLVEFDDALASAV